MKNEIREAIKRQMESNSIYRFASNEETKFYQDYYVQHGGYPCLALYIILKTKDSERD
jgi:hypothetical protein